MKQIIYLILLLLLFIIFKVNSKNSGDKFYTVQTYGSKDCSGEIIKYHVLLLDNSYCFGCLLGLTNLNCDGDNGYTVNSTKYECWLSNDCLCESNHCKQYYNLNQCFTNNIDNYNSSSKIVLSKLNYYEGDYCVLTESKGINLDEAFRYRMQGAQILRNSICFRSSNGFGVRFECDLNSISYVICDDPLNTVLFTMDTREGATLPRPPIGNFSFLVSDLDYMVKPILKK